MWNTIGRILIKAKDTMNRHRQILHIVQGTDGRLYRKSRHEHNDELKATRLPCTRSHFWTTMIFHASDTPDEYTCSPSHRGMLANPPLEASGCADLQKLITVKVSVVAARNLVASSYRPYIQVRKATVLPSDLCFHCDVLRDVMSQRMHHSSVVRSWG